MVCRTYERCEGEREKMRMEQRKGTENGNRRGNDDVF